MTALLPRVFVLSVFLAVSSVLSARAQTAKPRFEIFAQFGSSTFSDARTSGFFVLPPVPGFPPILPFTSETSFTTTGRVFTGVRIYGSARDAFEASYSYSPNDFRRRDVFPTSIVLVQVDVQVHNVHFNYVRYLPGHPRVRPFFTGGLGFTVFDEGFRPRTKFAGNFGGGVDVPVANNFGIRAEFRDFLVKPLAFGPRTDPDKIIHNLVPSVGVFVRF